MEQAGCPCPPRAHALEAAGPRGSSLRSLCSCRFLTSMRTILAAFALLAANHLMAAPPEGIPRDLARQRAAEIQDLRYHLRFTLTPHASSASGHEDLQFRAGSSEVMLIDFREGSVTNLAVNGVAVPAKIDNGHIELPANTIHPGENSLRVKIVSAWISLRRSRRRGKPSRALKTKTTAPSTSTRCLSPWTPRWPFPVLTSPI